MALTDKVALVTGAGRGIGKAISLALAGVGATVALAEIDAETLEATASEVGALGRPSLAVQADIGNLVDIDRMVREAPEEAYEEDFMERLRAQTGWSLGG